jgi:hypothetical protein
MVVDDTMRVVDTRDDSGQGMEGGTMESLERDQSYRRRRRQRPNKTGALGAARWGFLVAVFVVGNHATVALQGNGDRSSSMSFGGMPSRNIISKPMDTKEKDSESKEEPSDISSPILSSPFLDSFQEEVHEIVKGYRAEVRNTFRALQREMITDHERKVRLKRQLQEQQQRQLREAKADSDPSDVSVDEPAEKDEKETVVEDELGVTDDNDGADWDDMDAASLVELETDSKPPFKQERFDIFSDLAGEGTDEVDSLVVGDTDEEEDAVLGRLLAQSVLSKETSQSRLDGDQAVEALDSDLVQSVVQKTTKKKKKKKKAKKEPKTVVNPEASNSNEDSDLVAATMDDTMVAKLLRSMSSTGSIVVMYVLTILIFKILAEALKR